MGKISYNLLTTEVYIYICINEVITLLLFICHCTSIEINLKRSDSYMFRFYIIFRKMSTRKHRKLYRLSKKI